MRRIVCTLMAGVLVVACIPSRPRNNVEAYASQRNVAATPKRSVVENVEDKDSRNEQSQNDVFIQYDGFTVSYNAENLIPNWVRYELTAEKTDGPYSRKGLNFRQDPSLTIRQADNNDYRNSGWSRGHMAPAGDFKWSDLAMSDTFFYTNCCPQDQSLNAGQWNTLEEKVRTWAKKFGVVTVISGPIIGENKNGTIGSNRVTVPDAFFKTILAGEQAIAFVMYNHNDNANMKNCAMSVDELELLTGYDFFSELDDEFENRVEASYSLRFWRL